MTGGPLKWFWSLSESTTRPSLLAVLPQSNRASALAQRYGIQFIPTLIIIDDATKTISFTGREEVVQNGAAAYDAWLAASGGS
jgi:hypothetical protein